MVTLPRVDVQAHRFDTGERSTGLSLKPRWLATIGACPTGSASGRESRDAGSARPVDDALGVRTADLAQSPVSLAKGRFPLAADSRSVWLRQGFDTGEVQCLD